ncbi:MAG: hypothetical protein ACXACF_01620 [Candidatus Hermodarchaeia archaeon]|jgi:predicted ABC-class ATPase
MGEILKQFKRDCARYYKDFRRAEEKRLRVQERNHLLECKRLLNLLKKKEFMFKSEIREINEKIIPYIKRKKHMPLSYRRKLTEWELDYVYGKEVRNESKM